MRNLIVGIAALLCCGGCIGMRQVVFTYYNLSGQEIRVVNIAGMPPNVTPGVLVPAHNEDNRLEEKSASFFEPIRIEDRIKIVWQENGSSHELELERENLDIPAKVSSGNVRFTYLGNGKWRVKLLQ